MVARDWIERPEAPPSIIGRSSSKSEGAFDYRYYVHGNADDF